MVNASVRDVAVLAGVSPATVSRVLNGTTAVSKEAKLRVQKAIAELDYVPSAAARTLRSRRTGILGLVLPSLRNPFFPELVSQTNKIAAAHGYGVLLAASENPSADVLRMVRQSTVDGVLFVGSTSSSMHCDDLNNLRVPLVAIDGAPKILATTVFQVDNEAGAYEVTSHLVSGDHQRIAHIAGPAGLHTSQLRQTGYLKALDDAGLTSDAELIAQGDFTAETGFAAAKHLMRLAEPPTAIFAANDMMAIGAMSALRRRKIRGEGRVAIAGFDGLPLSKYVTPGLTTYQQPVHEIATQGVVRLLEAVRANDSTRLSGSDGAQIVTNLPGKLIVRKSSFPTKKNFKEIDPEFFAQEMEIV